MPSEIIAKQLEAEVDANGRTDDRRRFGPVDLDGQRQEPSIGFASHRSRQDPAAELPGRFLRPDRSEPWKLNRALHDVNLAGEAESVMNPLPLEAREATVPACPF